MTATHQTPAARRDGIAQTLRNFLAQNDPTAMSAIEFLGRRFDAGLAWVHAPVGSGGLGWERGLQADVEQAMEAAGAEHADIMRNPIGLGMAAPTLLAHAAPELKSRLLRPLWTGEEMWCQLFSEPGAGSDLAGLATRAIADGDDWIINGQKVWTTYAHISKWAMLLARTDPSAPKHTGMTYFLLDMTTPGVHARPLRQATGQADFNEVFLDDVRISDNYRISEPGAGWSTARTTLVNERAIIGGNEPRREDGHMGRLTEMWRKRPELRTGDRFSAVVDAWICAEVARLSNERTRQLMVSGEPGVEGSGAKVTAATNNQIITRLLAQLDPSAALDYDDWSVEYDAAIRPETFHYLRARANTIEGGTTEILLGQIADRILDLPRELKLGPNLPWQDIPK
ncbi:alkylation response protein AidB-like acyl-CoA dehydrogenase [Williamsia muralis]|uniref:Alkylation response protein AidB-like acyl-CoA dehydrogenase n=1 Tax=Williamsia marianensis TaxID=85044 RepID=A0A495K8E1_WILMA|nr:acyl-CoA dehydrogenase family protein [Williamsia muralis]RKR97527.1 alkylation response protein AidB-like acyl-CoA dehydrogenase [Williamsia muralis]